MANLLQINSTDQVRMNSIPQDINTGRGTAPGTIGTAGGAAPVSGNRGLQSPGTGNIDELNSEGALRKEVDFQSTFASFVRRLQSGTEIPEELTELLFREGQDLSETGNSEIAILFKNFYSAIRTENPEELLKYIRTQTEGQTRFQGVFFDNLRALLSGNISKNYRDTILQFVRQYTRFSSGPHFLRQMKELTGDLKGMMLSEGRDKLDEALKEMNWDAGPGDTKENTRVLNQKVIPLLSGYIGKTHDFGSVRKAAVLFVLYAAKYEEGSSEKLTEAFFRMSGNHEFQKAFHDMPEDILLKLMTGQGQKHGQRVSDLLAEIVQKGTEGKAGTDAVDRYYQVLNSLLNNESVYMPLLHTLIPFRYKNQTVMSEMWTGPVSDDAKRGKTGSSRKIFLKFHIENLGSFDLIGILREKRIDMQVFFPETVKEKPKRAENAITEILKKHGFTADVTVSPRLRDIQVMEVFPEIREKEKTINVRI